MYFVCSSKLGKISSSFCSNFKFSTFVSILPSVSLQADKAKYFLTGNPLIYDKIVTSVNGSPQIGDEVSVKDHNGKVFARGFYNPQSMYRVRLTSLKDDQAFDLPLNELIKSRIDTSIKLRQIMSLPSKVTNAYRLVNGEGDRLSGLIIDVLGDTVVVQSSAVWAEKHSDSIKQALQELIQKNNLKLLWRQSTSHLKKDGFDHFNSITSNTLHNDTVSTAVSDKSAVSNTQTILENGLKYRINAHSDQKTGFYCDQRENRLIVKGLAKDKTVLDTYCYSGGFTMNALAGECCDTILFFILWLIFVVIFQVVQHMSPQLTALRLLFSVHKSISRQIPSLLTA
jgi:23S rRNA G2069 N7-methylase RlmK/C1962 C5-methylase RlmI